MAERAVPRRGLGALRVVAPRERRGGADARAVARRRPSSACCSCSAATASLVWSEQRIPSGVAALLVGTVPCFMVLIDWLRPGGPRPTGLVVAGLLLGLAGSRVARRPGYADGRRPRRFRRRRGRRARVVLVGARLDLLAPRGDAGLAVPVDGDADARGRRGAARAQRRRSASRGRSTRARVSLRSALGLLYLVVFGSIVAFSAYIWLLRVSTPARVSTYAYVNPVVAVLLGWALAGEALTVRMVVAAAVIVSGVALITLAPRRA